MDGDAPAPTSTLLALRATAVQLTLVALLLAIVWFSQPAAWRASQVRVRARAHPDAAPETRACPKCGTKSVRERDRVCTRCGAKLSD